MNLESQSRWRKVGVGFGLLVLLTGAGLYFWKWRGSAGPTTGEQAKAEQTGKDTYYCPMHPSYKSDEPDNCPVCSMKLVKMETAPGTEGKPGHQQKGSHCGAVGPQPMIEKHPAEEVGGESVKIERSMPP